MLARRFGCSLTLFLELAVKLDLGVEAANGHAQAMGNIDDRLTFLGHLLDRFDLNSSWRH